MSDSTIMYDFVVIGGGSGGMSSAKTAAALGAKVLCLDFVTPSTQGTTWGLGGTCVNVGCVPKKLMHYSAHLGHLHEDARQFGFDIPDDVSLNYKKLVGNSTSYVKKLNFSYKKGLKSADVTYVNAKARLTANTNETGEIIYTDKSGQETTVYGKSILLAVGGRPVVPIDIDGATEHAITSDDIFWRKEHPGKTLVVGGSYIALECAGFLASLKCNVTVAVRSILLRGFDRQCAEKIGKVMEERGTKFKYGILPTKIEKTEGMEMKYKVTFADGSCAYYDTVMYATGRYPDTVACGVFDAGIQTLDGKIDVSEKYQTNISRVYAVGDILAGGLELTPVAIAQGETVAKILFGGDNVIASPITDVPTAVFTPVEYGSVGLTEEMAIAKYGEDNIEVYHQEFEALEVSAANREKVEECQQNEFDSEASPSHLAKLICMRGGSQRVIGIHFVGDHAGEVIQGFAIAFKTHALVKSHFDSTIGIHPTAAEVFCTMDITKRSGENHIASGGCGGGKCG